LFVLCGLFFVLIRIDLFWVGLEPNGSHFLSLILTFFFLGSIIGLIQLSGRTLWGDAVLRHYQSASTDADPLQRVALFGPTAMVGGRLDDLRILIENVQADLAASASGCS
jgi:hypothetical protein